MHLRIFQDQVLLQCKFLLLAADTVNTTVTARDTIGTFSALQALLNAAANISKAFWGPGGRRTDERLSLRQSVGVTDDSLEIQDAVNAIEGEHRRNKLGPAKVQIHLLDRQANGLRRVENITIAGELA